MSRKVGLAWPIANLLILAAVAIQLARVCTTSSTSGETPFHSANDRSRWCTIASLVEDGTYEIDSLLEIRDRKNGRPWYTIDLVQHRGLDGRQHFYSSKPPLLATLYAGVYAPIFYVAKLRLSDHPLYVGRLILMLINTVPLYFYWRYWGRTIWRDVQGTWARWVLLLFLLWGTFLSTFAVTLNNHLPAAFAVTVSLAAWFRITQQVDVKLGAYLVAGAAAAFAATCDLPALSWFGILFLLLLSVDWRKTLIGYLGGAIPVAIAFAWTTYLAHQDLRPPYAHRGIGAEVARISKSSFDLEVPSREFVARQLEKLKIEIGADASIRPARWDKTWELWDEVQQRRFAIVDVGDAWRICHWDDWYDYPGSYWRPENKRGVDRGEASVAVYTFHVLFGHHGVFSLTPIWLLAVLGAVIGLRDPDRHTVRLVGAIVIVSGVCLAYYCLRPLMDRNYGGVASGFRWLFWLTPLWFILVMKGISQPGFFRRGNQGKKWYRPMRLFVQLGLAISIFSASYAWSNPWVHPWLFNFSAAWR